MKAKNIIHLLVCCLTSILVACSDSWPYSEEAYNNTWVEVYPSYITLDKDEFSSEFAVKSSESWYVYESPSWINLSEMYGFGYDNVSFTVDENDGSSNRSGYIRIRTNEGFTKEAEVKVSQPPTVQFEASMSTTNYSASGDWWYLSVKAASSRSWTISKSDRWVHLGNSYNSSYSYSGKGNENVKIYVDANTSSSSRRSSLTIKCGTKTKTITITQDGKYNKAPFTITSVEVGNMNYNGDLINNYGTRIYSYQTQYLSPRIYVTVQTLGTYTIYVKLFNSNGTLVAGNSSPTGYSYSDQVTLDYSTSYKNLTGWGGRRSGFYSSGKYRWEFWYNGSKIGEKTFTIY